MNVSKLIPDFWYIELFFESCSDNVLCYRGELNGEELSTHLVMNDLNGVSFNAGESIKGLVELVGGEKYLDDINFYLGGKEIN